MLRLHDYAASANCYKARLLLAQLGRPYERVPVDIFAGETLTDEYRAVNPMRTTPVLELEDGRFLPESNAILLYLAEGTPFLPDDPFERAQVVGWLIYEQTDVVPTMGGLRFRLHTRRLAPHEQGAVHRRKGAEAVLGLLDDHLAGRAFLVGDRYSIADIAVYAYVHVAGEAGLDLAPHSHLQAWLDRVRRQPGYMNDLAPYPANSAVGTGRSIYE